MLHIRPFTALIVATLIGLIGLAATAAPAAAYTAAEAKAPMSVTLARSDAKDCGTNCPEWIALTGKILPQTPPLLRAVLARTGAKHLPVLIDSPGGAVEAAIAMGRMIRARRLDVAVAGTALTDCAKDDRACLVRTRAGEHPGYVAAGVAACASACVLVLAAGTDRVVGRESYVGVHQMTASRTLTHVINTFRIMRRLIDGHPVEVSRTLIATRPVSSHVVLSDAPVQTYTEVDKYLLGMGIGESIMPLMRSTPRTGIHWMTPVELAATRISIDTTDARTLVGREAEARGAAKMPPPETGLSALTLDDGRRWLGAATWHLDGSSPDIPRLVVDIAIPVRHLMGTVTFVRSNDPANAAAYTSVVGFVSPQTASVVSEMRAPQVCDLGNCLMALKADSAVQEADGPYIFNVPFSWGDAFLSSLRDRYWLDLPVRIADGWGKVTVPLTGASGTVIAAWERLCCGLAPLTVPRLDPDPPLPPLPTGHVAKLAQPDASAGTAAPAPLSVDGSFSFSFTPSAGNARAIDGAGTVDWMRLGSGIVVGTLAAAPPGLRMSMMARVGASADVTVEFDVVTSPARFGPVASMQIPPVWTQDAHIAIFPKSIDRFAYGGGYRVSLQLPGEEGGSSNIEVQMTDTLGRRLTVALPIAAPLRDLFQDARERHAAGAG